MPEKTPATSSKHKQQDHQTTTDAVDTKRSLTLPSYWRLSHNNHTTRLVDVILTKKYISDLVSSLWTNDKMEVKRVQRVENGDLFDRYAHYRRQMKNKIALSSVTVTDISKLTSGREGIQSQGGVLTTSKLTYLMKTELHSDEVNEHYLFHGCSEDAVRDISDQGFDFRLSKPGFYGRAVYFAETPEKSDQYTGEL